MLLICLEGLRSVNLDIFFVFDIEYWVSGGIYNSHTYASFAQRIILSRFMSPIEWSIINLNLKHHLLDILASYYVLIQGVLFPIWVQDLHLPFPAVLMYGNIKNSWYFGNWFIDVSKCSRLNGDEVTRIRKYYVIFVYILQGKMGKTEKKPERKSRN